MTQDEIDALAASMLRQQNEERQKQEALARANAEAEAAAAGEREERERPAREAAAAKAGADRGAIGAVLSAGWGTLFVDQEGTVHRKAGPAAKGTFETAGSTKDGQTVIGRWGHNMDNSALAGWRKKD